MRMGSRRDQKAFGNVHQYPANHTWTIAKRWARRSSQFGLFLGWALLIAPSAWGASYQKIDGNIVNPIQSVVGEPLSGYSGPDLSPGVELESVDLTYADLTDADLTGATMQSVDLTGAILAGGNLVGSKLRLMDLSATDFRGCDLRGADLSGASAIGAWFESSTVRQADFSRIVLHGGNLRYGDFRGVQFVDADVSGVDFEGAQLGEANFSGAFFQYAVMLGDSTGSAKYDADTDLSRAYTDAGSTLFDPVAAGWIFVPEPSSGDMTLAVLAFLGVLRVGRSI